MAVIDGAYAKFLSVAFRLMRETEGQGLAEYGLILALVAVVCAAALVVLQGGISNTLNTVSGSL